MKFLDSFQNLFKKKEDGTKQRQQEIENSLHAKIKIEKQKHRKNTMKKLKLEDMEVKHGNTKKD